MSRRLLLASSFPPSVGGLELYLANVAAHFGSSLDVVAPCVHEGGPGEGVPGGESSFRVHRFPVARARRAGLRDCARRIGSRVTALAGPGRALFGPDVLTTVALLNRNALRRAAEQAAGLPDAGRAPDVVYCGTALPSGLLAGLIARRSRTPYVIFAHGAELLRGQQRPHHRALLRKVLRGAARVGAVSEYTAGLVRGLGVPAARVVRTPPAIDPGPFVDGREDDLREALGLVGRRVLLTHGRLDPRKGHDVVIRALGRVARAVPEVSYLITGTGPTEGALRRLAAEEGVAERVRFGGRIPQERLPALYRTCDLFLMPSRRIGWNVEGFGIVALEAGAAGRAVVAGRSGGTGDAVVDGETGCLVDPEDPAALAERLIALLGNPAALREMGAAGRARVTTSFDLRAHARRLDELDRMARASAPRG